MTPRKLSLKREALHELTSDELAGVAGAGTISDTCYSCMTFISCHIVQCVTRPTAVTCVVLVSLPDECVQSVTC